MGRSRGQSEVSLLGGGGHASDVLSVIEARARRGFALSRIFVADDLWSAPERFQGRTRVELCHSIEAGAIAAPFIVSVGFPGGRRAVYERAIAAGGSAAEALLHPDASIGFGAQFDQGAVVMGQTWVSPLVQVGRHTHIGYGATIGHDTVLGEFCSVMPAASIGGDVEIGTGAMVGANATILQGLKIGRDAVIGAGAVVLDDVDEGHTLVGNPARSLVRSR